jgi:hypothetical protein
MSRSNRTRRAVSGVAVTALALAAGAAWAISQSGEQKDMRRVGHVDLQGREAYQPNVITYPDGRVIAFAGTHGGTHPNPLNGGALEPNGTMIVDITNPAKPVELFHVARRTGTTGTNQMARLCKGSDLGGGLPAGSVYLMRNYGRGYETYDVTDPKHPVFLASTEQNPGIGAMPVTHKQWWECRSGIAYLPGSRTSDAYAQRQSMVIVDWKDPRLAPTYIRTFTLPGGEPGGPARLRSTARSAPRTNSPARTASTPPGASAATASSRSSTARSCSPRRTPTT